MKLLALQCPVCARPLAAGNDDLIVACEHCHTVVALEDSGLRPVEITFAAPAGNTPPDRWLPMWIFQAQVWLQRRETQGGSRHDKAAQEFWGVPRNFYVPAWDLSLETLHNVSLPLLESQPHYRPATHNTPGNLPLHPVRVSAGEARKLSEFLVLETEVQRKDWLKSLEFTIEAGEAMLWALPAGRGDRLLAAETF